MTAFGKYSGWMIKAIYIIRGLSRGQTICTAVVNARNEMKKMLGNSITVIAVLVCAAVLLVPMVDARDSGTTAAPGQGGPGNGNMIQMQAPPSGNTGNAPPQGGPGTGGNAGGEGSRAPPDRKSVV